MSDEFWHEDRPDASGIPGDLSRLRSYLPTDTFDAGISWPEDAWLGLQIQSVIQNNEHIAAITVAHHQENVEFPHSRVQAFLSESPTQVRKVDFRYYQIPERMPDLIPNAPEIEIPLPSVLEQITTSVRLFENSDRELVYQTGLAHTAYIFSNKKLAMRQGITTKTQSDYSTVTHHGLLYSPIKIYPPEFSFSLYPVGLSLDITMRGRPQGKSNKNIPMYDDGYGDDQSGTYAQNLLRGLMDMYAMHFHWNFERTASFETIYTTLKARALQEIAQPIL